MHDLLEVKIEFKTGKKAGRVGPAQLPIGGEVTARKLRKLAEDLADIADYWRQNPLIEGALVSVHYNRVVAKSNRITELLKETGRSTFDSVRGAKFELNQEEKLRHVITHFIPVSTVEDTVELLQKCAGVLDSYFGGGMTEEYLDDIHQKRKDYPCGDKISKSQFAKVLRDAFYIDHFDVDEADSLSNLEARIVSLYRTGRKTKDLLRDLGLRVMDSSFLDEDTVFLSGEDLAKLQLSVPYLISAMVRDMSERPVEVSEPTQEVPNGFLPPPPDEPEIGVIDTLFDDKVYFREWVTADNSYVSPDLLSGSKDYWHGTEVCSVIVDGIRGNPWLDDGCGSFRVRHFGVAPAKPFSSFTVLKSIQEIVRSHRSIKVWNLSLGSRSEVPENMISIEAAELDKLQSELDVIFVIAGTNKPDDVSGPMRLGAPADSINGLVVNATDRHGNAASYSRRGPVLHFFNKPDVSAYGGDGKQDRMVVCNPNYGAVEVTGTSFAAPWVTRKIAYLMYRMGLSREVAKALVIDAASGWNKQDQNNRVLGFGCVPRHIDEILRSRDDEIRFVVKGEATEYETYVYDIPVPVVKGAHPFFAKATLCYFPSCSRFQGVDYTDTEMDIHFGRTKGDAEHATIDSVNKNRQDDLGFLNIPEQVAREWYRKWDNVKVISDVINPRARPKRCYANGGWGLSVKLKSRGTALKDRGIKFAVVVTLKEMNGIDRSSEFVKRCEMKGWIVNNINRENRLKIHERSGGDVVFSDE